MSFSRFMNYKWCAKLFLKYFLYFYVSFTRFTAMIIRFILKNFLSFKEETVFNLLPNKNTALKHHKVSCGDIDFLRFSAIYGANASGKSNLIKAIDFLEKLVEKGELPKDVDSFKFKLEELTLTQPISLGIEFVADGIIYFYTITFDKEKILYEYLAESKKKQDELIFEREVIDGHQKITFNNDYYKSDKEKIFADVLEEKVIVKDVLAISFLGTKYPEDFPQIFKAYAWFKFTLIVIEPGAEPGGIAHLFDKQPNIINFANKLIPSLQTGITELEVDKRKFDDFFLGDPDNKERRKIIEEAKSNPNAVASLTNRITKEELSIVYEDGEVMTKRLVTKRKNLNGDNVEFNLGEESDGTKRLIDFIPAFHNIIHSEKVYVIDEIERSIHPILIKEMISKLALDENIKGQLIFSTHESNLLDQNILRPDEIWFVQKDVDGASRLYSLSDFKIHNTISIENGYLKGRFGGIPFVGNLKELNWDTNEISNQK